MPMIHDARSARGATRIGEPVDDICWEQDGDRTGMPVLLVHGIGCQLVQWPRPFIDALTARGYRVVRFDNRDVGQSAHLEEAGMPDMAALLGGTAVEPPYRIADMAADAIAVLDHLGLSGAHVIGVSMGGMIGQQLAALAPERVFSLVPVMSSSGAPDLPQADPAAQAAMFAPPPATDRDSVIRHMAGVWDVIGGPVHRSSEVGIGTLCAEAFDRGLDPAGFARQLAAILADTGRAEALRGIDVPTLVVHGDVDPLIPLAAGEDIAARIPGADLHVVEGMGHDLPAPLVPALVERLDAFFRGVAVQR